MALFDLTEEAHLAAAGKLEGTALTADGNKRKRVRIQMFRNRFLERWFGTAHPLTPGLWAPVVVAGLYLGMTGPAGWALTLALFGAGLLAVTLIEYLLHRFIFHMEPRDESGQMSHFIMHGYHHDFPQDGKRLVFPLVFIVPLGGAVAGLYWLTLGAHWLQIFAGTALGYMLYDWVHYYTHHFKAKRGIGGYLRRYHILHHFDSPNHRYGITSPLWDIVFGTYLPIDKQVRQMHADRARNSVATD